MPAHVCSEWSWSIRGKSWAIFIERRLHDFGWPYADLDPRVIGVCCLFGRMSAGPPGTIWRDQVVSTYEWMWRGGLRSAAYGLSLIYPLTTSNSLFFWHSLSVCLQEVALCVMCTVDDISVFICACVKFAHYWVGFARRRWSVCVLYK